MSVLLRLMNLNLTLEVIQHCSQKIIFTYFPIFKGSWMIKFFDRQMVHSRSTFGRNNVVVIFGHKIQSVTELPLISFAVMIFIIPMFQAVFWFLEVKSIIFALDLPESLQSLFHMLLFSFPDVDTRCVPSTEVLTLKISTLLTMRLLWTNRSLHPLFVLPN